VYGCSAELFESSHLPRTLQSGEQAVNNKFYTTALHLRLQLHQLTKMMMRRLFSSTVRRLNANSKSGPDFFKIFPKTFPEGMDAKSSGFGFVVDSKKLRKEYRKLQSESHPDLQGINVTVDDVSGDVSSLINKAYETLSDPLRRAQHILKLRSQIDLADDIVGKTLQFQDPTLLMEMMDVHEQLENIVDEKGLRAMRDENQGRIDQLCEELQQHFQNEDWEKAAMAAVRLKYCYNIKSALKDWEAGKPVTLTH
jgi:molecular chaperone HscB